MCQVDINIRTAHIQVSAPVASPHLLLLHAHTHTHSHHSMKYLALSSSLGGTITGRILAVEVMQGALSALLSQHENIQLNIEKLRQDYELFYPDTLLQHAHCVLICDSRGITCRYRFHLQKQY